MDQPAPQSVEPTQLDVLIIGAGQAGLGTAYWLDRLGVHSVQVIDATPIGDSWLNRWDSLRLFTPRRFSALPGLPFPPGPGNPTRVEVARYLRSYADYHALPVATGHPVRQLTSTEQHFLASTGTACFAARQVVVATGPFSRPYRPKAASSLNSTVAQLHSADYHVPSDVPDGDVVVVGGGNSAAQLAIELADRHAVTLVSPRPPWFLPERLLGVDLYWWLYLSRTLNADNDARISRYVRRRGDAIVGTELRRHIREGRVRLRAARVVDAAHDTLHLSDGAPLHATTVLWCTGYRPDLAWLHVRGAVDADGQPIHDRGVSPLAGLHWMGLPWQTRLNSSLINGVDRDAHVIAERIRTKLG